MATWAYDAYKCVEAYEHPMTLGTTIAMTLARYSATTLCFLPTSTPNDDVPSLVTGGARVDKAP